MKALRIPLFLLVALSLSSCDKIKEVAGGVSSKVGDSLEERLDEPEEEVVPLTVLQMLVKKDENGVVFRKDVPFPTEVRVLTRMRRKIDGRIFHESELERKIDTVKGKESIDVAFERNGSAVTYLIKDASFVIPAPDGAQDEDGEPLKDQKIKNPFNASETVKKSLTFTERGGAWKGNGRGDFKLMALSQQLSPVFNDMVVDNSLKPRTLWFSPSPIKIGDEITITGDRSR